MRIGIIGFGRIAPFHAQALLAFPDVELVVATRSAVNQTRATEAGAIAVYSDWREMVDKEHPDALVCAVPMLDVAPVLSAALETGLPILVEKPVGLHPDTARELADRADSLGCSVMVAMNRRFYGNLRHVKELVASEKLIGITVNAPDRVHLIAAAKMHPDAVLEHWLFANIIHSLDLIRFWGGDVSQVQAWRTPGSTSYSWSHAATVLLESGVLAQYTGHFDAPGKWLIDAYFDGSRVSLVGHESGTRLFRDGTETPISIADEDLVYKPGFYGQARHFLKGVESGSGFAGYDLRDAAETMELIQALHAAHVWEGSGRSSS